MKLSSIAQSQAEADAPEAGAASDEDVVDADFEEVSPEASDDEASSDSSKKA